MRWIATCAALATLGCDTRDDKQLWGDDMSPTQLQKSDAGPRPMQLVDPGDGESEDPFTNNPGYPYVEESWNDPADSARE